MGSKRNSETKYYSNLIKIRNMQAWLEKKKPFIKNNIQINAIIITVIIIIEFKEKSIFQDEEISKSVPILRWWKKVCM